MVVPALLGFCRIVIGLVFGLAFLSKVTHFAAFTRTITQFGLLPERLSSSMAACVLGGELVVTLLVMLGGPWLERGFLLGMGLLTLFCLALISVLVRRIETSCDCFGPSQKPVSTSDVWRNVGLMTCALLGCVAAASNDGQGSLSPSMWVLLGLGAILFVTLWLHLHEIAQLFEQR